MLTQAGAPKAPNTKSPFYQTKGWISKASQPNFGRRSLNYLKVYQKALKHHPIDPSLPPMQRADSALHVSTLTGCYNLNAGWQLTSAASCQRRCQRRCLLASLTRGADYGVLCGPDSVQDYSHDAGAMVYMACGNSNLPSLLSSACEISRSQTRSIVFILRVLIRLVEAWTVYRRDWKDAWAVRYAVYAVMELNHFMKQLPWLYRVLRVLPE